MQNDIAVKANSVSLAASLQKMKAEEVPHQANLQANAVRRVQDAKVVTEKQQKDEQQNSKAIQSFKDVENLKQSVTKVNDAVQNIQRSLNFSVDEESGKVHIKVIDSETNKVIRSIPADEIETFTENLNNQSRKGLILQTEV